MLNPPALELYSRWEISVEICVAEIAVEDRHFFEIGRWLIHLVSIEVPLTCGQEEAGPFWPVSFLSPTFKCSPCLLLSKQDTKVLESPRVTGVKVVGV